MSFLDLKKGALDTDISTEDRVDRAMQGRLEFYGFNVHKIMMTAMKKFEELHPGSKFHHILLVPVSYSEGVDVCFRTESRHVIYEHNIRRF